MSSTEQQRFDDQVLTRYFLGTLPEAETQRVEELSIADDSFALRLDAVENDLVDAYAREELSPENLPQFKKSYLSSPQATEKVQFAQALCSRVDKGPTQAVPAKAMPGSKPHVR
jgi:anti-sigma-K factor RskA